MPQRGGSDSYAERFRREKLGKTDTPTPGPTRAGADALPSRSLGGPYIPGDLSNLNPTVLDDIHANHPGWWPRELWNPVWQEPGASGHDAALARGMTELATRTRPTGDYGGTTPGSTPVVPASLVGPPIDYRGGGGGVTANDILGQFGPVVTSPLMTLLQAFLSQRRS